MAKGRVRNPHEAIRKEMLPAAGKGRGAGVVLLALLLGSAAVPLWNAAAAGHSRHDDQSEGEGVSVELNAPEGDVLRAVDAVVKDEVVHGTYVYEREKTLTGAVAADSSAEFGPWKGPGKAFYKILTGALAPRHFKNSSDMGTISVRYLVQGLKDSKTRVEIEAVFVEDARRTVHASDGSVESSELKEIEDRLRQIQLEEERAKESAREHKQMEAAAAADAKKQEEERNRLMAAEASAQTLEQRVNTLRHQVVRLVAGPGVGLKAAPFQGAASFRTLIPDTEVVILIVTPYWYGVETSDGQRGWLRRDQVRPLP